MKPRYSVISTTGHLIDYHGGYSGNIIGSREWDQGPLTTWYIWDSAYCRTVSEHGSYPEARGRSRKLNALDREHDAEQERLHAIKVAMQL